MPGLPDVEEKEALKGKMNSYGKTWHTWMTGMRGVDAMAGLFPNAKPVPGVTDNGDTATRPVPTFGMKSGQGKPTGR